jgi:hypothetical protein
MKKTVARKDAAEREEIFSPVGDNVSGDDVYGRSAVFRTN